VTLSLGKRSNTFEMDVARMAHHVSTCPNLGLLTCARKTLKMLSGQNDVRNNQCDILPAAPGVLRSGGPCGGRRVGPPWSRPRRESRRGGGRGPTSRGKTAPHRAARARMSSRPALQRQPRGQRAHDVAPMIAHFRSSDISVEYLSIIGNFRRQKQNAHSWTILSNNSWLLEHVTIQRAVQGTISVAESREHHLRLRATNPIRRTSNLLLEQITCHLPQRRRSAPPNE